jgi:inositol-phosphate transport system substrate-binding protein
MAARGALLAALVVAGACSSVEEGESGAGGDRVRLTAWTIGPEPSAYTRKSNLVEGARRLNQELAGRRVELEADFATTNNDAYGKKLVFAFASGHAPDIVCGGHEIVGQLAPAGYLAPLDSLLAAREEFRRDFYPLLWDAVRYGGRIYGVPQDNEVRLTFVRKDLLRRMGWSDQRIDELPRLVEAGRFTLDDLAALAEEAVRTGAVAPGSGVWHRNRTGFDWLQFLLASGGELAEPGGALVLSRAAAARTLAFFDRLTDGGATPPGMMSYPNRTAYAGFVEGRVLAYLTGGSWHKREWQESFGLSDAEFRATIAYFPIPSGTRGGRPVSISHPFACMVSASARDVELAFRVIERSLDPDLDVAHAIGSSHLVVRRSSGESPAYRADPFLAVMIELLRFSHLVPNHAKLTRYNRILFDAIRGVEVGALERDEAVDFLVDVSRARLGDEIRIAE